MTAITSADPQERFGFGENWARFLSVLDDDRIAEAERSLDEMLGRDTISGASFLDIGSGSGLFSLAAHRLGAARLHSFDYDPASVGCTQEMRRRFAPDSDAWTVERGSVLDGDYVRSLGTFDVVYSWGVLHHTGDMWTAIDHAIGAVAPGGRLFIAIYNDQGLRSRVWRAIKRTYNRLPESLRLPYTVAVMGPRELLSLAAQTALGRPGDYVRGWTHYKSTRGMSRWHDIVDWVGGYPFEVATPDEIFDAVTRKGFTLERLITRQGLGCNEFVFRNDAATPSEVS